MKSVILILCMACSFISSTAFAQESKQKNERQHSTYYYQRASHFELLPTSKKDIIFLGNSITDGAEWSELFANPHIKNRGISGDTTWGVYDRLNTILKGQPKKVFLLIGINDIGRGKDDAYVLEGIKRIVSTLRTKSPKTRIYVQSLLPVNPFYGKFNGHTSQWERISTINKGIKALVTDEGATYIDLFSAFADNEGKMKKELTNDGLHLVGKGYQIWKDCLLPYIK